MVTSRSVRSVGLAIAIASVFSMACSGSGSPVLTGLGNVAKGMVTRPPPPDPSTPEGKKLQEGCAVCKARFAGCTTCQTAFTQCTFEQASDTYGYCKL
jgi:hypothetical protein